MNKTLFNFILRIFIYFQNPNKQTNKETEKLYLF